MTPRRRWRFNRWRSTLPDEADLAAARTRLLEQKPEVRQARIGVDLARTDVELKKLERVPKVSALFGYVGSINMPLLPGQHSRPRC